MAQKFTSAATSINSAKLPAVFSKVKSWEAGTVNLDLGGGRFDNATEFLAGRGVSSLILDPYNRTEAHNTAVIKAIEASGGADTVTCSNVLNVIMEDYYRDEVIQTAAQMIKPGGVAYFTVYEGNKSGNGAESSKGWQENRATASYLEEIANYFGSVTSKGGVIIARLPFKFEEAA